MIINHNLNAMNAHRMMNSNIGAAGKSMEKLSSGLRINRAGDDAAGLAISEKMRGQIRGLDQASRNSQDGISMIQTAEGALNEEHSILQRMKELATQAANGTNTKEDTSSIQQEINQLTSEINRIGNTTEFNKQKVLQGGDVDTSKLGTAASAGAGASAGSAKEAVKAADAALASSVNMTSDLNSGIKVNGQAVALTNVKALSTSTTYDLKTNGDSVVDALQKDIDAVSSLKDKYKVSIDSASGKLSISSVGKGSTEKVDLTGSDTGVAGKLGFTTLTSVSGSDAPAATPSTTTPAKSQFKTVLQIGANEGQAFSITIGDMRAEALGISQKITAASAAGSSKGAAGSAKEAVKAADAALASSVNMTSDLNSGIKVNGQAVALTNVKALSTSTTYDLKTNGDSVVDALQKDIDAVSSLKDKYKVSIDSASGKLSISSVGKGSTEKVDLTGSDTGVAGKLGFTTLTSVSGSDAPAGSVSVSTSTASTATAKKTHGNSGEISVTDQTKYTGKSDATWKIVNNGTKFTIDKGDGNVTDLTLDANKKVTVDGLELDMSKVSSPQANDAWEVAVTAAKSASTTTSTTTVATAAKASAVKIGDNSFTIDAGKGNGADGNIAIEIKQSANAGEDSTAVFSNDGKTLTLTLDKGKTFTSDDIQKLISSANKDDNKPTYLDMTKFTVKADDAANDSIDASKLSGTTTTSLSGGASLPTFTSSKKAEVTNGTDDVVVEAGLDVSDHDHATHAISVLDKALAMVSTERGKLGAMQNRLEHTINNLNTSSENLSAAESRIRDTDMANEMMTYSKSNILSQASQAMIAQAKSQPEQVLQLLR